VCGFAQAGRQTPVPVFTIGYDVADYDERRYARVAARHFGLDLHERQLTAADAMECLDHVAAGLAEPYGNPSALAAYLCAKLAAESGVRNMLAGDGGDELFAGNSRYQTQMLFNIYARLPAWLRGAFVDPAAAATRNAPGPLRKLMRYVSQARIPLPERLFSYNLLVRNDPAEVLTPEFLRQVDAGSPYRYAKSLYQEPPAGDVLDRMLYLDWTLTLSENDLPKVQVATGLANATAYFPMLDPDVVAAAIAVPSADKLTLRTLRKFYKETFATFLPAEVTGKRKHGFGVPIGPWMQQDAALRDRILKRVGAFASRGIVRPEFIEKLLHLQQHGHTVYYGDLLWILFMLEEWLLRDRAVRQR
jgi:asparagine synthase (glutamine-hydrolysing)